MYLYGNCHYFQQSCYPSAIQSFSFHFALSFLSVLGLRLSSDEDLEQTKFVIILLFWLLNSLADPTWAGCQVQEFGIKHNF